MESKIGPTVRQKSPSSLPVLKGGTPGLRPLKASRWRIATLISVHLFIAAHIAHWMWTGSTLSPLEPSEAMEFSKYGVVNAGLLLFVAATVSTALFGRFFCGWGCHLIALQDLSRWLLIRIGIKPRPLRSRLLGIVPTLAFFYMFLWPTIYRLWRGDDLSRVQTAYTTTGFWDTFPGWTIGLLTIFICGCLIVFFLGSKGFCTYACPYGAILGAADRLAPTRIRVTDACQSCGACTAACTSNVRVHEQVRDYRMVVDSNCMKCLDCVAACPNGALYLGMGRPSLAVSKPKAARPSVTGLSWPTEILLAVAFATAFFTFRGLYGRVPFLLALGSAAILAYWTLTLWRLRRSTQVRLGGVLLRHQGRLLESGKIFLVLSLPVYCFWLHSAFVHLDMARGESSYRKVSPSLFSMLDFDRSLGPVDGPFRDEAATASSYLERADRWGLVSHPRVDLELAWLALAQGQIGEARDRLTTSLARHPNLALAHLLAARLLVHDNRLDQASTAYSRVIELDPDQTQAYLGLGVLLARVGDLETSIQIFDQGLSRRPDSADLNYNAGITEGLLGRMEQAIARFEKALEIEPSHLAARENLRGILESLDRHEEAERWGG